MRPWLFAAAAAGVLLSASALADDERAALFLSLVKERHIPPVSRDAWASHVGDDCVWVGRGLRVVGRAEVQGLQVDTGKRVEIQDFTAHDYGDTAVLTYLVIEHQPQDGREITTRLRKMDTYLSRQGRWQLVANAEVVGAPDRKPVALDAAILDRYTGTYETALNGSTLRTRVWRQGARLLAQTEGQEPGELLPLSATTFFDAGEPQEGGPVNEFLLDASGNVTTWIYRDGQVEVRSTRLRPAP